MSGAERGMQLPPRDGGAEPLDAGGAASRLLPKNFASNVSQGRPQDGTADPLGAPAGSAPEGAASRARDSSAAGGAVLPSLQLRVSEIFFSLQGETTRIGLPTVFVRLTGCPLRCTYCDTTYAFTGGRNMSVADVLDQVAGYAPSYVTVTGGEPLAQKNSLHLLRALCDAGYLVSLETSGGLDVGEVDARVMRVVDVKTPASGESEKNRWENFRLLGRHDEIKFVLCDESDYHWANQIMQQHRLPERCEVVFSPAYGTLEAAQLAEWILRDHLPVRMLVQLHKLLWRDARGR